MARNDLSAICFPSIQVLPPTKQEVLDKKWTTLTFPTNTLIAAQTWMPSICLPAGFAPGGIPVGIEFVGCLITSPTYSGSASHLKP
jgi:amidase